MQPIAGYISLSPPSSKDQGRRSIHAPVLFEFDHGTVALSGRPRFGDARINTASDAARLLEAFRRDGTAFLADMRGPFALAVHLAAEQRAAIAIDRMGIERLAWAHQGNSLVFGASAERVAQDLDLPLRIKNQAIFDFMLSHMISAPGSVFEGIRKLEPGHVVEFDRGNIKEFRFWSPTFDKHTNADIAELQAAVLPTLGNAIKKLRTDQATGAFLSGGLDSSTVTGLLSQVSPESNNAFSVGFGVAEFDEMEFASTASQHFGCRHFIYEVTADDIVDAIPKISATYDEPFGNSSAVPTYFCAKLAKDNGVDHLLAGDGGDELFGGNERYTRHRIFEAYQKIPAGIRSALLEPAAGMFDPEESLLPFRKFASYVQQARIPLPERFESWNLIYREGPENVFSPGFLESVDPLSPLRHMKTVWDSCPSDDWLDRMLWYDWKFTLADNDIRKVSTMGALAGVRISYPMLDEDFVDLSMCVPSNEKIRGNELRTFFKNSVRDFLPDKIIRKQKHGFGLPFGQWLKTNRNLQELVYSSLDSLKQREILNNDFLQRVVAEHREGHASYYGYAIWDLVMLEQWFQHHKAT